MGYRQCSYENLTYENLISQKEELAKLIDERVRKKEKKGLHFSKINSKKSPYYEKFSNIYFNKCAYCGISVVINSISLFEIDHFVNKTKLICPDNSNVDSINNLVFSCRKCNQAKSDFDTTEIHDLLHPDNGNLALIFKRGKYYEIDIEENYKTNKIVNEFYKKLEFDNRFRKLDYLLTNVYYIKENIDLKYENNLRKSINDLYIRMIEIRNNTVI